jgi:NlpC/P60 family protein
MVMQYLGVPYRWGGAQPTTGFDCSGLVEYVFARLGVSLPHYTVAQWNFPDAVPVAPNRLEPGDLVFFTGLDGTFAAPGHVGIYIGGGDIVDAPHTGSFVRIDSLSDSWYANNFVGARRIVGVSLDGGGPLSGPPTTGATVARHELVGGTRRLLLHAAEPVASSATIRLGFPRPVSIESMGESHPVAVMARLTAPLEWAGAGLGVLLVLLCGAFGSPSSPARSGDQLTHRL